MRVAFLSVSAGMGGSETSLLELLRGLRRLAPSWRAVLVVPREGPLASRAREAGAEVRVVPLPDALARFGESGAPRGLARRGAALVAAARSLRGYVRVLRDTIEAIDPDVVHTNGFKVHVAAAQAIGGRRPLVWHVHEYVTPRPLSRRLLRANVAHVSAIVTNSASVAADVRAAVGERCPVATVLNAVDLSEFAPAGALADLAALSGLPPAAPGSVSVGLVGTFGRWKGHETFLRAIATLAGDQPSLRPYIVGGALYDTAGSQFSMTELRQLAASAGLAGRVGFTGFVDRPATALRALDVVVHASTQPEPFGLVIAEAMACGRALVASGAGGAAEIVTDGVDALTHAPGDVAALASAIRRLASDAALRGRLGRAGRKRAERDFDPDVFTRSLMKVYEDAAAARGLPA